MEEIGGKKNEIIETKHRNPSTASCDTLLLRAVYLNPMVTGIKW